MECHTLMPYIPIHIQDIIYDRYVDSVQDVRVMEKKRRNTKLVTLYRRLFDPSHYVLKRFEMSSSTPNLYNQHTIYLGKNENESQYNQHKYEYRYSLGFTYSLRVNNLPKGFSSLYFVYAVSVCGSEDDLTDLTDSPDIYGKPRHRSLFADQKYIVEYELGLLNEDIDELMDDSISDLDQDDDHLNEIDKKRNGEKSCRLNIVPRSRFTGLENDYILNHSPTLKEGIEDGLWLFYKFAFQFFDEIRRTDFDPKMICAFENVMRRPDMVRCNVGNIIDVSALIKGIFHPTNKRLDLLG